MKTKKRAFLVLAPESHGGHLVTDLLVHGGCVGNSGRTGDWYPDQVELGAEDVRPWVSREPTDGQPWDRELPFDQTPIVWRRSVPHGGEWPDIRSMVRSLERIGYRVEALVVTRDRFAAVGSQLKWHHARNRRVAKAQIKRAYAHIFSHLAATGIDYSMVSYEALVSCAEAGARLLEDLGLRMKSPLPIYDGNAKWYAAPSHRLEHDLESESVSDRNPDGDTPDRFPEHRFRPAQYLEREYAKRVRLGRRRARGLRVAFCGLARNLAPVLRSSLARIGQAGGLFAEYWVYVYENDSSDDTPAILARCAAQDPKLDFDSERLALPEWQSDRSAARMANMAGFRNRCLDHILTHRADVDYLIVVDLDTWGFSCDGLLHSFGYEGWDVMGSNGITLPLNEPGAVGMFYDAWAFRWQGDTQAREFTELNALRFERGQPLRQVWSCFGGLAVYRMAPVRSGARYEGGDCEHVSFHRNLRARGFDEIYLNPSQVVVVR